MKVTTADRLKWIMKERNLRQADILNAARPYCEQYGVKLERNALSQYVSGKVLPRQDRLTILGLALNVSEAWLMGYDVPMERDGAPAPAERTPDEEAEPRRPLPSNFASISELHHQKTRLIGHVAAGQPILTEEDYESYVDSPVECDVALRVEGASMYPLYQDGDVVYIRRQPDVEDGQIAVVIIDDSATLKYVYKRDDGLVLRSENPAFPDMLMRFEEHEYISIYGIPVGYTRIY